MIVNVSSKAFMWLDSIRCFKENRKSHDTLTRERNFKTCIRVKKI